MIIHMIHFLTNILSSRRVGVKEQLGPPSTTCSNTRKPFGQKNKKHCYKLQPVFPNSPCTRETCSFSKKSRCKLNPVLFTSSVSKVDPNHGPTIQKTTIASVVRPPQKLRFPMMLSSWQCKPLMIYDRPFLGYVQVAT